MHQTTRTIASLAIVFAVVSANTAYDNFIIKGMQTGFAPVVESNLQKPVNEKAVNVYVIDTGFNWSAELPSNVVGFTSIDFTEPQNSPQQFDDCKMHGTPVTSILSHEAEALGTPINVYALKVFGCEGAPVYNGIAIFRALEWMLDNADQSVPSVVNMSLSFAGGNFISQEQVEELVARGFIVVTSAGNDAGDACDLNPGKISDVITVGNIRVKPSNNKSVLNTTSNFGECVDLYSKGTFMCKIASNAAKSCSGTSFAAPVVSARIASYLYENGHLSPATLIGMLAYESEYSNEDGYYYLLPHESTLDIRHYQIPLGEHGKTIAEQNGASPAKGRDSVSTRELKKSNLVLSNITLKFFG